MVQDLIFLFWDTPLKVWGFLVFGGIGALMGHLIWFVSQDQLDRLIGEQENLRDQIENWKKKVAEKDRMKRENTWKGGAEGGGFLAGWKGFGRWLQGAPEPESPGDAFEEASGEEVQEEGKKEADDFTRLEGVDEAAAGRLRAAGVTTFLQLGELDSMTPEERARFADSFDLPPIPVERWRWSWTDHALEPQQDAAPAMQEEADAEQEPSLREVEVTFERPGHADDLTRIRRIDSGMEAALNREGIFSYEQIAGWTSLEVREIADRLDLADRIVTQRWIRQAAELAQEKEADHAPTSQPVVEQESGASPAEDQHSLQEIHRLHYAGETGSVIDPVLGVIYREKPELTDSLTRIERIEPTVEERLNRLGVYRYKQIADWTGEQIRQITQLFGLMAGRIEEEQWVEQARRLHKETYPVQTSWDHEQPSAEAMEERLRRDYAGEPVRVDPGIGFVYHTRPLIVDDLQQIRGIGPVIEEELHDAGIFRFKQIAAWAPSHVQEVAKLLNCFPDRIYRDRWIPQARDLASGLVSDAEWLVLPPRQAQPRPEPTAAVEEVARTESVPAPAPEPQAAPTPEPLPAPVAQEEVVTVVSHPVDQFAVMQSRFAGESHARVDPRLGIVYQSPPAFGDDLTRIREIDAALQAKLQTLGICRFKQIASWSDENATEIARRIGVEKRRMRDEDWPGQAEARFAELFRLESGWDKARPGVAEYDQRIREQFAGEPVKADEDYGIVYTAQPSRVDVLSSLEGIDAGLGRRLNASGVYRFRQLANWSAANVEAFARRLGFPVEAPYYQNWVGQATRLLPLEATAVTSEPELKGPARIARDTGAGYNEQFGYLYPQRPAKVDDLRAIRGVDVRLAGLLNHQGIYRFWQIEHWTNAQRDLFAQRLGLGQAVEEQRWREQCRRLSLLSEAQQAYSCPAPEEVDQFAAVTDEFSGETGVRVDPKLGIIYDQRPPVADPLTSIQGLDPRHEQVLHSLGIYRFKQVANWKDENVTALANRLGLPKEALERGKWVAQAIDRERMLYAASPRWMVDRPSLADYERLIPELFSGESVRGDEELGVIFTGAPSRVDELRRIAGMDADIEGRLNAAGVYTFRQVASWSAANVEAFAHLLRIPQDRIYVQRWIPQAHAIRQDPPAVSPPPQVAQEPEVDYFAVFQRDFAGETGVRVDRLLGVVYDRAPGESDELTRIPGLEARHQELLNNLGMFRFKQIAHWSGLTVREVARRLQVDPESLMKAGWPAHAARLHSEIYRASAAWNVARPSLADYEARIAADLAGQPVFADEELGILYRGRPEGVDALQRIQGITPELERQLQAAGVFRFWQIAVWSEANVDGYERFLGCPKGGIYRQRWIPQAAALAQEVTAPETPSAREEGAHRSSEQGQLAGQVEILERLFAGEPGARVDRRFGIVFDQTPRVTDDLSLLRGVSPEWQHSLNQFGIYRFKQIDCWTEGNLEQVAAGLGTEPERLRQEDWKGQAQRLHHEIYSASPLWTVARPSLEDYQREIDEDFAGEPVKADEDLGIIYVGEPGRRDDLTRISGVDASLARRLNASGVYRFKQISRWSEANVEAFARWLDSPPDRIYRDRWVPQSTILATTEPDQEVREILPETLFPRYAGDPSLRCDSELGWLYREAPAVRDDLRAIRGIDASLQERLAGYGIYRFWQIAQWSPEQARAFASRLQRGKLVDREEWVRQAGVLAVLAESEESECYAAPARVDQFEAIEREFAGEFGLLADPVYGIVYGQRPEVLDDLTRIEGLTGLLSEKLHKLGVFRYKQMANWSDGNVEAFAQALGIPKEQIERQKWVPRARKLHLQAYQPGRAWTVVQPTSEEYEQRIRDRFAPERVKADPDCGIIYVGRPGHIDDLTDVEGIDALMARKLHATGIYCFRQLENWAEFNVRALAQRLEILPERVYRERWIQQAEALACQLPKRPALAEQERETAPAQVSIEDEPGMRRDERFGLLFRQRPAQVDHLRSIKGVGPKIERRLNDLGVYRFRQMANWNERQVKEVAERLHLWGRIDRERWVEQARELAELTEAEAQDVFLAPERVDQMAILDAEFGHEPSVRVDPYLGIVFDEPPTVVDDLSLIDGIGQRLETELNLLGVFRYNQIAAWTALNVVHFARHLFCEQERIERDKWIPQAKRLYRETYSASWAWGVTHPTLAEYQARIEEEFATEAVRPDEGLGVVYTGWPSHVDDFTRIQSISRELERSINRLGIFTFEQIANWAEGNVDEMATRLGIAPQQIYRDRWITQAAELAGKPAAPSGTPGSPDPRLLHLLAAEPGLEADEQFGLVYGEVPAQVDPLTSIRGIGFRLEKELNKLGVCRHRQIACWAERNVKAFADRLRLGGRIEREHWVTQAKELTALAEFEAGRLFVAPATVDQESVLLAEFGGESSLQIDPRLGILYEEAPEVKDNLTLISGIGPRLEEELNELGIYRFKQIGSWSDGNVGEFAQRLFCYKDRIERDKWVPQARRMHREIYRASPEWGIPRPSVAEYEERIASEFPGSGLQADREYGLIYPEEPEWPDPLTKIRGLTQRLEQDLRELGVYTFAQIACWSDANVDAFASRLRIPRDRILRDRWIFQACDFRELLRNRERSEEAPPPPVRPAAARPKPRATPAGSADEPRRPDRKAQEQALRLREREARERERREREEREREVREQEEREREEREESERLERLERERLEREREEEEQRRAEELQRLHEERERAEEERRLREERQRLAKERMEREARDRAAQIRRELRNRSPEAAPAPVPVRAPAQPASPPARERRLEHRATADTELEPDDHLGELYRSRPERVDDLKQIRGVTPKVERQLQEMGVYRFRQIASWTRKNADEFTRLLDVRDRIHRENWVEQAWELARLSEEEESDTYRAPKEVDTTALLEQEFTGEWGVALDEDLGVLYEERPEVVDDLKLIRGVGARLERELNSYGVYRFKQIAHWSDHHVAEFAKRFNLPKEKIEKDKWIPQAKRLHRDLYAVSTEWAAYRPGIAEAREKIAEEFAGEEVVTDPEEEDAVPDQESFFATQFAGEDAALDPDLGIVFRRAPVEVDDLKRIRGIGRKLEQSLNEFGVYQYRQIALWTNENAEEFASRLNAFRDRIFRDNWMKQARMLYEEKYGERLEVV